MANNLGVSSYTVGGDFDTWGAKYVADMAIFNKFAGDTFLTTSTGGILNLTSVDTQNFSIQANGGTSTQLDIRVPDAIARFWYARNDRSTGVVTIRCAAGGTAVTLNPGERRLIYSDGVNIADLTLTTISIASVLNLQAALDGKLALPGGTMTGALVLAADPTLALHAATKQYVDSIAANLGKRQRVRVMDTSDSDPATSGYAAGATIDGVTLVAGDQVVRNSASHTSRNGVWVAPASGAAARALQFDTYDEHPGTMVAVEEGTASADTLWLCTSNLGGTLDVTAILFSQIVITAASTTVAGTSRLATVAETRTGTDATIATTPAGIAGLFASAAEIWAATAGRVLTAAGLVTARAEVNVADAATLTFDLGAGLNFKVNTIGGNRVAAFTVPASAVGLSGYIRIKQDGTGGRTLDTATDTKIYNANGIDIVLSTSASATDIIYWHAISTTEVILSMVRAIAH